MRAVTVSTSGGPEVLELTEVDPPIAGSGEVLIKVRAAGVNRADLMQRQGHYPPPPGASQYLGLECSGQIVALGEDVTGWEVGDLCVALLAGGGYAEYVAVPVGQVVEPPESVDLVTAAGLMEVAATVASNVAAARLQSGETFLVHGGSGGIGSFAVQYAKALGARVIATAGSDAKLDYCRSIGADLAVSYSDDWVAAAKELTEGRGVDAILDPMGAKYLPQHVDLLALEGRLVVIGLQGGRQGTLDLAALLSKRGTVMATSLRSRPVQEKSDICALVADSVWPRIARGEIVPAPQTTFALADVADAHRHLESGDNLGKVILTL